MNPIGLNDWIVLRYEYADGAIRMAVAQLWQREIGESARDVLAELDELRRRLEQLERNGR